MKRIRHIIIHSLLAFGLLVLPMQSAWAMADMASCDMDSPFHDMSKMSMSDCSDEMGTLATTNLDCGDNHCNECFHSSFFILTNDTATNSDNRKRSFVWLSSPYLSITLSVESPPPIIS